MCVGLHMRMREHESGAPSSVRECHQLCTGRTLWHVLALEARFDSPSQTLELRIQGLGLRDSNIASSMGGVTCPQAHRFPEKGARVESAS